MQLIVQVITNMFTLCFDVFFLNLIFLISDKNLLIFFVPHWIFLINYSIFKLFYF